jgi:hypothetical protein
VPGASGLSLFFFLRLLHHPKSASL